MAARPRGLPVLFRVIKLVLIRVSKVIPNAYRSQCFSTVNP